MSSDPLSLEGFSGTARLFPLPNLVFFPLVIQPLHVFEPRYREMMADAIGGDRLLTMVLLRPGWEEDYQSRPAVHAVACVGRIFQEQKMPDGRYNLLLHGLRRVRILEELPADKLYRLARVEVLEDRPAPTDAESALRAELAEAVPVWFAGHAAALGQIKGWVESDMTLGALCDIFSFALPVELSFKQSLLEELDVARRVRRLLDHLKKEKPPRGPEDSLPGFPPDFSAN